MRRRRRQADALHLRHRRFSQGHELRGELLRVQPQLVRRLPLGRSRPPYRATLPAGRKFSKTQTSGPWTVGPNEENAIRTPSG